MIIGAGGSGFDVFKYHEFFLITHAPPGFRLGFGTPASDADFLIIVPADRNTRIFNFSHDDSFEDAKRAAKINVHSLLLGKQMNKSTHVNLRTLQTIFAGRNIFLFLFDKVSTTLTNFQQSK